MVDGAMVHINSRGFIDFFVHADIINLIINAFFFFTIVS